LQKSGEKGATRREGIESLDALHSVNGHGALKVPGGKDDGSGEDRKELPNLWQGADFAIA